MFLRDLAHARAGDKGNTSNISVIAFAPEDYPRLCRQVTPERIRAHFGPLIQGDIERYELPFVGALNFVLHGTLGGGVTRSLTQDAHGKCLGPVLLDMPLPDEPEGA